MQRRLARVISVTGAVLLLFSSLPLLAGTFWLFDIFSHFVLQYVAGAVLLLVAAAANRTFRSGLPATLALIVNAGAWGIVPARAPAAPVASSPDLTVAHFNVQMRNRNTGAVIDWIRRSDADVVFVMETSARWTRALRDLPAPYRIALASPTSDHFGTTVISRVPVLSVRALDGSLGPRAVEIGVRHQGTTWTLLGIHPPPPISAAWTAFRDRQLDNVQAWAERQRGLFAVVGDFNATPYSEAFGRMPALARASGLDGSWPYDGALLTSLLRIPIDHALVGPHIDVLDAVRGPPLGSDHRPLTVRLRVAPAHRRATDDHAYRLHRADGDLPAPSSGVL